jgi:hypothetical protein
LITEQAAIERARQWVVDGAKASVAGRKAQIKRKEIYIVVFPPPPDTLGGDFTVLVDAETGSVLSGTIER